MGRSQRRHSTGFGYIGFGNNQSVFNRRSKMPFSEIKEKLHSETHLHYKLDFLHCELTETDRTFIKNKIKKQERKVVFKTRVLSVVLAMMVAVVAYYLIIQIMSR